MYDSKFIFITVNKTECTNLTTPVNGQMTCSSGELGVGYEGDSCSFACDTGYNLTGSDTRSCQGNGSWNGTDTVCKAAGDLSTNYLLTSYIVCRCLYTIISS